MKKILSLILCLVMVFSFSTSIIAANFTDTVNHKNELAIDTLNTIELIEGYGNDVFGPDDPITRAQLCTMLVRALYNKDLHYSNVNKFEDVPLSHWARIYIDTAYRNGLMVGNGDGTFTPDSNVTYTEVARTILNALGYGTLAWPDGVNLVTLELGLYDNISTLKYDSACTRAHAAQMIYNAFDKNLVKDHAGIPMVTTKTFLADLLGYKETVVSENGIQYVAYENLATGEVTRTEQILTTECRIYPAYNGSFYRLVNSGMTEMYSIDWTKVTFYVNGNKVEDNLARRFATSSIAYGIFNVNGDLVSVHTVDAGVTYIPHLNIGTEFIPEWTRAQIDADLAILGYSDFAVTITYYAESGRYDISDKIVIGMVTGLKNGIISVDGIDYNYDVNNPPFEEDFIPQFGFGVNTNYPLGSIFVPSYPTLMPYNKYVIMYFNVYDQLVACREIKDPYVFTLSDTYFRAGEIHTIECAALKNVRVVLGSEAEAKDKLSTIDGLDEYLFIPCDACHARMKYSQFGYTLDLRIPETEDTESNVPETEAPETETPVVIYITKDNWKYYHSTDDCETMKQPEDRVDYVEYNPEVHTEHTACPYCVDNND